MVKIHSEVSTLFTPSASAPGRIVLTTGIECTRTQCQPEFSYDADVIKGTQHDKRFDEDFQLIKSCGINVCREPIPWFYVEKKPGIMDWRWPDKAIESMCRHGLEIIGDGMHHTGCPGSLSFEDTDFAERYVNFVMQYTERYYPHIKRVNLFNEPLATLLFCGLEGRWHPMKADDRAFVRMCLNVGKAICMLSRELRRKYGKSVVQFMNDSCECHSVAETGFPTVDENHKFANWMNQRRFLMVKLVLDLISEHDEDDYLIVFLRKNGCTDNDLAWFEENPATIDDYGLDYYPMHEHCYYEGGDLQMSSHLPARGFADIVSKDYWPRLKGRVENILVGETNLDTTDINKCSWLKYMLAECETLAATGIPIAELCWYGFIGGRYWRNGILKHANRQFDDFGVCWLERGTFDRKKAIFYKTVSSIAKGGLTYADLPLFPFQGEMKEKLSAFSTGPIASHGWEITPIPEAYP